jgi:putative hemolysin
MIQSTHREWGNQKKETNRNNQNRRSRIMQTGIISHEMDQMLEARLPMPLAKVMEPVVKEALRIKSLDRIYHDADTLTCNENFAERVLQVMNVEMNIPEEQLALIPKEGPLIVVANHPFGGIEGLALLAMLKRVRPDVKLMANYMLGMMPSLKDDLFEVDPFGKKSSRSANGMRGAMKWLKEGHVLGVFPAGEVSSFNPKRKTVADKEWSSMIGSIALKTGCDVQCVYFDGHNSKLFQTLGLIHPRLRTLMLPHAFLKTRNHPLSIKIGHLIPNKKCQEFTSPRDLTKYLRVRTYVLSSDGKKSQKRKRRQERRERRLSLFKHPKKHQAIAPPVNRIRLAEELRSLPDRDLMVDSGKYKVYCVKAEQIPIGLQELGRLREETFRAIGEGTGLARDLDWHDQHYRHLILWHDEDQEIVGAYRVGISEELLAKFGRKGLYTASLFRFSPRMLDELTPGMELGRSFIQQKYQKSPSALGLLWKGVMAFIHQHPTHCKIFGPVSISNDYDSMSKRMIIDFIKENHFDNKLALEVKPSHAPKIKPIKLWDKNYGTLLKKVEDVNDLIAEVEPHMKNAPVLIRQYLRLNGRFLCFNVDPDFENSLDALMLADFSEPSPVVERYMGKEKYQEFMAIHETLHQQAG